VHHQRKMLVTMATRVRGKRGEGLLSLLIFFECLACFFLWWGGLAIVRGEQPEHRNLDMLQRQRRADWFRNELEQRPWWWLMLSALMMIVLADWFWEKWAQRPWRAATLWTIAMSIVLVVVVALTAHFGWGIKPVKV
jgi:magnesium-transporting ATPase (P-type)